MLRQSKRKAIANLLVNTDEKDKPLSNSTYTDDELLMLTNLQRLQSDKKNNELIEKARFQLSLNNKAEVATQISNLLLNALVATRQEDEALRFLDKLERGEPRGTRWPLARARIVNSPEDKIRALTEACKKDDQSPEVHLAIARFHEAQHSESIGVSRSDSYENAINSYKCSLELDPSKRNSAWSGLHDLYHEGTFSTAKKN